MIQETLRGDAQLAEMKFMLSIPLARESVRQAHTLLQSRVNEYNGKGAVFRGCGGQHFYF